MDLVPLDPTEFVEAVQRYNDSKVLLTAEMFPVLGWTFGKTRYSLRFGPTRRRLEEQVRNRPDTSEAWQPNDIFAKSVREIIRDELGWPNDHFLPSDPARLLFWAYYDGLDLDSAFLTLEEKLNVFPVTEEQITIWNEGDFGSFVADLRNRVLPENLLNK